jgi:hypothetical protein
MKENKRIVISVLLIFLLVAGSYLFENIMKKQGMNSAQIVKVTEKGKVVAYISADVLRQLMEQNSQKDEDNLSKGPSLILAMNAAGASNFKQIEVKGKGEKASFVLEEKDINSDLELFLENNGTINLCKKDNSSNFLVKEITEINIKN